MGRNDIFIKRSFFPSVALQKPFDYLVLDRDNNEFYRKWNKNENYSTEYAESPTIENKPNQKTLLP